MRIEILEQSKDQLLLYFYVIDSGIGIDKKDQENIFDGFSQVDTDLNRKFEGTGLGLSICKKLLEQVGSKIELSSIPGQGSTFSFKLKFEIHHGEVYQSYYDSEADISSIKGKRILIVEDNHINTIVMRQFLTRWGCECAECGNGKQALNMLEHASFDLILMDLNMPEMDGLEATKRIRSLKNEDMANIPIIALSALQENDFTDDILKVGFNDAISKPFNPQSLLKILSRHLNKIK